MTERAQLHLVDADGVAVSLAIREATEAAFRWVAKDYPNFDKAQLADLAEVVAALMQERESAIESPGRYAYTALKGRVRDWLRTGAAQEENSGIRRDMVRIGGSSAAFQGEADRQIMLDQLQVALTERDRDILVLMLDEQSGQEIAAELKISHVAARKAIQRVRERSGAILGNTPVEKNADMNKRSSVRPRGLALE